MPKEYRTIREVAGPLMMVSDVEGVTYDELGEIELPKHAVARFLRLTAQTHLFSFLNQPQALTLQIQR